TKPFDYEDKFPVKNPQTGKLEEKIETRKFSHLQFIFNSQKEVNNFSAQVKTGQFYEAKTSWSSYVKQGKVDQPETEFKEVVWVKETNPQIKKFSAGEKTGAMAGRKSNTT
ncbi:4635_t:CDS:1, partial [Racocetra persica]